MRSSLLAVSSLLLFLFVTGCGSSNSVENAQVDNVKGDSANSKEGPDVAVHRFLEAVRAGNDDKASQMLTPVAREKTAEYNMVVAPPGSDTASFKIGEIEMIGEEGAHVASFWTDVDESGQEHTDTIIWMVRKEPQGWRIAGMATRVFEDKPAVILNFEEPEEMLAKQQEIEEEMSRRSRSASPENEQESTADTRNQAELPQTKRR